MYHPHSDEMVQMAMGMMGSCRASARSKSHRVDRDFVFLMSSYDIDPGTYLPKVATMTDFNLWTWNSRVFPGIDPLVVRGRPRACAHRQPDDDQSPDSSARARVSR